MQVAPREDHLNLVLERANALVPPAVVLPAPGANSVRIFGGERQAMNDSSMAAGLTNVQSGAAAGQLILAYETPEDLKQFAGNWSCLAAFQGMQPLHTQMLAHSVSNPGAIATSLHVRRGLTQLAIDNAPYGARAVANMSAAGGALSLPPNDPGHRSDPLTCRSQLTNYCAMVSTEKQLRTLYPKRPRKQRTSYLFRS